MSFPESSSIQTTSVSPDATATAAELRVCQAVHQKSVAQEVSEHERRQKFRRMIDPGIMRPNAHDQALRSLKTLLTISENLIREPNIEKYQRFKPTNSVIKRDLMDPKGTLEYAREMGFHPQVIDFQPLYIFNPKFIQDLKLGAAILKDYIELTSEKELRAELARKNEKITKEEAAKKVKLAFMDDRKTRSMRDELERERRARRATTPEAPVETSRQQSISLLDTVDVAPPAYDLVDSD